MISPTDLNAYVGKSIGDICTNGYANAADNHCAHFVSHAMGYGFGYNCKLASGGSNPGANLRVHEVFARCPSVGKWVDKPVTLTPCLVFVTDASNVNIARKTMDNVPRKHIGIFIQGTIWHYSNSHSQVVTQTPGQFIHHYPGSGIALFYGELITV